MSVPRAEVVMRHNNAASPPPENPPYTFSMAAMNHVIASLSPDDTDAALGLLELLEECGQMDTDEAAEWRWRINGWVRFQLVDPETVPS